ncbi:glycosyltransferase [Clavibacter sepedonicus]|uniref:Glycosyl transferase n=1 Tax=Clavibacter sepedonicus TaxID=31964 RepID=B0RDW2_CLASE|nr:MULTISPECIES: glycosyltransferase [Clavibacter]MBD5381485.1 glycosyltransferase [Clavibacter sp.]OQJ49642.1 glycosyl transferase [Clavibacter sepedonicus]OQJ55526.1 glycosyl transferase [Clavibacter sepedonicus]UUK65033.1 glycosyltransferase [Clavibacter sepedonicus]CAQ00755.1 putative glycosyl transferase [Clavibacter sepedonicus]
MTVAPPRVVAVVVAYNRRELVMETLGALGRQSRQPDAVVVVDNASTDGSADAVAAAFPDANLTRLARNTGGAGGFAVGIERALHAHEADLVWLMDDDTVPDPGALAALLRARAQAPARTVVLASAVRWVDGRPHPMNTPRTRPSAGRRERERAAAHGCVPVRSASFVSFMVEADAVRRHGLPVADYFLWNDDFEYSTRLLRRGRGHLVVDSTVEHRTRTFGSTDVDPGARFYFEVRNKVWLLTRSRALSPVERVLYAGAATRSWARTFLRSSDRAVLADGLRRGLRDGFASGPRESAAVLADLGGITEGVARLERGAGRA